MTEIDEDDYLNTTPSVSKTEKQFKLRNGCEEGSTLEVEKVTGIAEIAEMNDSGGSEVVTQRCVFNKDDICVLHGVLSAKVKVTKLKWKYLGKAKGMVTLTQRL